MPAQTVRLSSLRYVNINSSPFLYPKHLREPYLDRVFDGLFGPGRGGWVETRGAGVRICGEGGAASSL